MKSGEASSCQGDPEPVVDKATFFFFLKKEHRTFICSHSHKASGGKGGTDWSSLRRSWGEKHWRETWNSGSQEACNWLSTCPDCSRHFLFPERQRPFLAAIAQENTNTLHLGIQLAPFSGIPLLSPCILTAAEETAADVKPRVGTASGSISDRHWGGTILPLSWEPDWCFPFTGQLIETPSFQQISLDCI